MTGWRIVFPVGNYRFRMHPCDGQRDRFGIIDWPVALLLTPLTLLFNASVSYNMAILGHVGVGAAGFVLWLFATFKPSMHGWPRC